MNLHLPALVVLVSLLAVPAYAQDFDKVNAAYIRGDYAAALRELRPLAEQGNAGANQDSRDVFGGQWRCKELRRSSEMVTAGARAGCGHDDGSPASASRLNAAKERCSNFGSSPRTTNMMRERISSLGQRSRWVGG